MRQRPSARLLVLNDKDEVLMFRFAHKRGPLAGQNYWSTSGGAVEEGETFEQAGLRELEEETGIKCSQIDPEVARREFVLQLADGEFVNADERYFIVRPAAEQLSFDGRTDLEVEVMGEHKWWSLLEIANSTETIWPENLVEILASSEVQVGSNAQKAIGIARAYLASRRDQNYSEGTVRIGSDGRWRCWFERQSAMTIDPIHTVVLVDLAKGMCEIQPVF